MLCLFPNITIFSEDGDDETAVVFAGSHSWLGVAGQLSTWRRPTASTSHKHKVYTIFNGKSRISECGGALIPTFIAMPYLLSMWRRPQVLNSHKTTLTKT